MLARTQPRWAWTTVAAIVVVALATGAVVALRGEGQASSRNHDALGQVEVVVKDLAETTEMTGTVEFLGQRELVSGSTGTVTLPARSGSLVRAGTALLRINDRPVVLLYGAIPMYRTLGLGAVGHDVRQLEENLDRLGYGSGLTVDDRFAADTAVALESWRKAVGLPPARTLGPADVVFEPGPMRIVRPLAARATPVSPGVPVAMISSTRPVIVVTADAATGPSAMAAGTLGRITLPSGNEVQAQVTRDRPPSSTADATTQESTAGSPDQDAFVMRLKGRLAPEQTDAVEALRFGDEVRVTFQSKAVKDALVVPVETILALRGADGGYGVEVIDPHTRRSRIVRVEVGLVHGGEAQITGSVSPGDLVVGPVQ